MPLEVKRAVKSKFMEFLAQKHLRIPFATPGDCGHRVQHGKAFHGRAIARVVAAAGQIGLAGHGVPDAALAHGKRVGAGNASKDYKFYDPNYAEHPVRNHIICNDCERIVGFESDKIEKLEGEITRRLGFAIKTQRLQITGTCEELKKLGACRKKSRC